MAVFEDVHVGDVILGHDGELWGIADVWHVPQLTVTLIRHGARLTAWPPPGTPVTVVTPADVRAEAWAAGVLIAAGLGPISIISEHWESGS